VSDGDAVSTTVTLKVALAEFPAASVAEQLTTVVPIGNALPEAGVHVTAGLAELATSEAVGLV
jgi:hypothetical protein